MNISSAHPKIEENRKKTTNEKARAVTCVFLSLAQRAKTHVTAAGVLFVSLFFSLFFFYPMLVFRQKKIPLEKRKGKREA